MNQPNSEPCPENVKKSIDLYVQGGVPTGSFLRAVLENNLSDSIGAADSSNLEALPHIVAYLYNDAPSIAWGSPQKVTAWLARKEAARRLDNFSPAERREP